MANNSAIAARHRFQRLGASSASRLETWARALRDAYFERQHRGKLDGLKRPEINTRGLLAKITRMIEREESRGGDRENPLGSIREAFSASDAQALRSAVAMLVGDGDMRPGEAESWADKFEWERFAKWADPERFDPMKEAMWTLGMTAAWIRWRESDRALAIEKVRRHWPDYLEQGTGWIEREEAHYDLGRREDRGYFELPEGDEDHTGTKHRLREALLCGLLKASRWRDGARCAIGVAEWRDLRIVGGYDDDGVHKVVDPDGREYQAVPVSRASVLAEFPEPAGREDGPLQRLSDAQIKALLAELSAHNGRLPTIKEAETLFAEKRLRFTRAARDMVTTASSDLPL